MQTTGPKENRVGMRIDLALTVRFGLHTCEQTASAENVSKEGLFINTNKTFPAGTQFRVEVDFPKTSFSHRAEVIWAIRVPEQMKDDMLCGMGVKFIKPDASWPEFFETWNAQRQVSFL